LLETLAGFRAMRGCQNERENKRVRKIIEVHVIGN